MNTYTRTVLFCSMLVFAGCASLPDRNMANITPLKEAYETPAAANDDAPNYNTLKTGWWHLYDDPALNALMDSAFKNNPDIGQIRARLDQANAIRTQSKAAQLPTLDVNVSRETSRGTSPPPSDYSLAGAASFELDLWQRTRAGAIASTLSRKAAEEDLHAAIVTLSASIVESWLDIISLSEQEALARQQIEVNKTVLSLQEKRLEMGAASALDLLQQTETLARVQAQLPDILSAKEQSYNALTQLLGNMSGQETPPVQTALPAPLPLPKAGLPSDILQNRPDILAAWLRLLSADWMAHAAWANRLPKFSLTGNASTSDGKIDALFDNWLLNLAAGMAAPIFDGGTRKAEHIKQKAIADERYHAYRETVVAAITDVENALIRNMYQDQKMTALHNQYDASTKTLEQARRSYTNGKSDYINVLDSIKNTQNLEQQILTQALLQSKERVRLYRALGGRSWARQVEDLTKNGDTLER